MISIDQLLQSLFQDVAKSGSGTTPGDMVQQSLAGMAPSDGGPAMPMSLGGPKMRVPGPPPVPGPRMASSAPAAAPQAVPIQTADATPYIPGNALTDASEGYRSGGLIGMIGNMIDAPGRRDAMVEQYKRQQAEAQAKQNMTMQALIQRNPNMTPEMAGVVARNPGLLKEFLSNPSGSDFDIVQTKDGKVLRVPKAAGDASTVYAPDPQQAGRFGDAKDQFDAAQKLRKEFSALAKPYFDVRDAYNRVEAATSNPSAAGDLALVFNFMKMLDPGSVVREGEFATAQNAAGIPDRIRAWYNNVVNGERLAEATRADFLNQARGLYRAQAEQFQKIQGEYRGISERSGLNPQDTIVDFGRPSDQAALEDARKAIGQGAPRDKVIDRLRQSGIEPKGL